MMIKICFEAIDLIPKLEELKLKTVEMEDIVRLKLSILESSDEKYIKDNIFKVELYFKTNSCIIY